ncbi:hypothetical protein SLEP1_g35755 [Rubroshorea leprosula]|uniref:Uncharacterized protein n=1 Tax=Rubroshorea leprosula TaxID=152421 RepID=A0AAV5KPE7_9ROSI|nr:hypothetical protein SLEP1_g35755 [Rubroshorea leprosula]
MENDIVRQKAKNVSVLNEEQQKELCQSVAVDEVRDALFAIGNDKAPGPDGLSAGFYKAARVCSMDYKMHFYYPYLHFVGVPGERELVDKMDKTKVEREYHIGSTCLSRCPSDMSLSCRLDGKLPYFMAIGREAILNQSDKREAILP